MGTYSPNELLALWSREEITVEQSIGQLIQHYIQFQERLTTLERRFSSLVASESKVSQSESKSKPASETKKSSL